MIATGTVKWFSNSKGYGFIAPDQGSGDVFVHFSAIAMDGYRTLRRGQKVQFELAEGPKGLLASNIMITEDKTPGFIPTSNEPPSQGAYSS